MKRELIKKIMNNKIHNKYYIDLNYTYLKQIELIYNIEIF